MNKKKKKRKKKKKKKKKKGRYFCFAYLFHEFTEMLHQPGDALNGRPGNLRSQIANLDHQRKSNSEWEQKKEDCDQLTLNLRAILFHSWLIIGLILFSSCVSVQSTCFGFVAYLISSSSY